MTYVVQAPFMSKSGEIRKGQVIAMPEDRARALVAAGKIAELSPCHACREYAWWLSIGGALVCGVCHPPASPAIVKKRISDPEAHARIGGAK